jgi:hypothetical protein
MPKRKRKSRWSFVGANGLRAEFQRRRRRNPANKYYKNGAAPQSSFLIAFISFVERPPWMVVSSDIAFMAMAAIFGGGMRQREFNSFCMRS